MWGMCGIILWKPKDRIADFFEEQSERCPKIVPLDSLGTNARIEVRFFNYSSFG